MKQQLVTMLELQDSMNAKVHANWREQNFAWYRAIWIECAELMDHYGWKWWKKQTPDMEQVILELIDIWHFGLSIELSSGDSFETIATRLEQGLDFNQRPLDFRIDMEHFAQKTLESKAFDAYGFSTLMLGANLSFEDLYRSYVGKNVLNIFRQDHGYKEGSYRKLWSGREDNEHLVEILTDLDSHSSEFQSTLYQALLVRYAGSE